MNLTNRAGLKKFILQRFGEIRAFSMERVSSEALDTYEAKLRVMIEADIRNHPSIGKTFKP